MIRKEILLLLLLSALVLVCGGCNTPGARTTEWSTAEPVNRPPFIHTIKYSGETLRIIAGWYTGDVSNWEALSDANPSIDFDKLIKGNRIFIPENMLERTEPLTQEFIDSYNNKSKPAEKEEKTKPVSKPEPRPKKDEDFDLIGPK